MKMIVKLVKFSALMLLLPGMSLSADNSIAKDNQTELIILTAHVPPYSYQNEKGEFLGSADLTTKALFKRAGINYSIKVVPWKRALKQLDHHSNLLIYPLSRTKEREDKFLWIAPLFSLELKVFGLREKFENKDIDITSGDYKFVCVRITVNCIAARELNVPESALVMIDNINIPQMIKMINLGHVDFLLLPEIEFDFAIKTQQIAPEKFMILNNYSYVITDFLAANPNLDKSIIEKLKAVVEPLSP